MGNMIIVWLDWTFTKNLNASDWQHEMQLCEFLGTCNLSRSGDRMHFNVVGHRVRCPFPILHFNIFLKSTRPIDTSFGVNHIYGKSKLWHLWSYYPGAFWTGPIFQKRHLFKNILLYSHACRKKSMNKACCQIGKLMALGSSV